MKIANLIFIYIILCVSLLSCHKDKIVEEPPTPTTYRYIEESLKPYKFKTGSYWIFENDTTGLLDSVIVLYTQNDFYWSTPQVHGQAGTKSEYFEINLKSFFTNLSYNDYLTFNFIKRNGGGTYGTNGQPIFIANSPVGSGFNGMEISSKLPTITINSHIFNNVDVVKITALNQIQMEFTNDTYLYYSDSIGLIKKVTILSNNIESWSIKRWGVIK